MFSSDRPYTIQNTWLSFWGSFIQFSKTQRRPYQDVIENAEVRAWLDGCWWKHPPVRVFRLREKTDETARMSGI